MRKKKYAFTLDEVHKLVDRGGINYYHFLHIVMQQSGKLDDDTRDDFIQWIEKTLKRKI